MFPQRELTRLAAHKAALQIRIGRERRSCASAATRIVRPLGWLDGALDFWHRLSPLVRFAAIPLGLWLKRSATTRPRLLGTLLRWLPLVMGAVRGLAARRDPQH